MWPSVKKSIQSNPSRYLSSIVQKLLQMRRKLVKLNNVPDWIMQMRPKSSQTQQCARLRKRKVFYAKAKLNWFFGTLWVLKKKKLDTN